MRFVGYNGVVYERLKENDRFKHSFLFIITSLVADSFDVEEQNEGKVGWFDYDNVVKKRMHPVIPTDVEFLKKYSKKMMDIEHVVMDEEDERLVLR